jgi:hypothetical protein
MQMQMKKVTMGLILINEQVVGNLGVNIFWMCWLCMWRSCLSNIFETLF